MHGSVEVEVSIVVNMLPVTIASEFGKISLVELDSPLESWGLYRGTGGGLIEEVF